MPFLDPLHPTQSSILELLASRRRVDMRELHQFLADEYDQKVSKPNLYRIVKHMVAAQVLVKERGKIGLNLVWVAHVVRFAQAVDHASHDAAAETADLPRQDGERREYAAESLAALDPLWNHLLLKLARRAESKTWYEYDSHPYYALGMPETESRLYQGLSKQGVECCLLHGGDTFLDRFGERLIANPEVKIRNASDAPFPSEGYILIVCEPYIVECVLPDVLTKHFAFFFETVRTLRDYDAALFADIFQLRAHCKISVKKSATDARMFRNEIARRFQGKKSA